MAKTFKLKLPYFTLTVHVHRENKYSYKETPSSLHTYIATNKTKEHKKCFTISTEKWFRSQKHTHQFAFGFRTAAEHFLDPC